ncbi:uncharacterized protein [Nicotiana tomentosiformis]|uniref:uncharacterized protein n=1 Tax=Nicotiana tomentosiformis TaxID=4098 RepID=UPI00388CBC6C
MATENQPIDVLSSSTPAAGVSIAAGITVFGVVDSAHHYYLHPSYYSGMNLVSFMFDGRGYGGWRRAVVIAMSAKNKLGFIDGSLVIPAADSGLQRAWARCNDMLQKELSDVVQGSSSVTTYFTKVKSLWDELDALNTFSSCVCDCDCGAKIKNHKAHQDERLLQFLMGLNECFIGVRSNILLSSPLPTIGQAYSLVIQDERQREIHASRAYQGNFASFITANQPGGGKRHCHNPKSTIGRDGA